MMFILIGDVVSDRCHGRGADGERCVSLLPRKPWVATRICGPLRGSLFQIPQKVGQAMGGLQANEQVHMIGDSADALGGTAETAYGAAEVFVKRVAPRRDDQRTAFFRCEDQVVMEASVS